MGDGQRDRGQWLGDQSEERVGVGFDKIKLLSKPFFGPFSLLPPPGEWKFLWNSCTACRTKRSNSW